MGTKDELVARANELFRRCGPTLEAFGDRNRQEILMLLGEQKRLNVGQIAAHSPLSRPAVSHHLKVLLQAGLVSVERQGTENYYSLTPIERLADLKELVEVVEQITLRDHSRLPYEK